MHSNLPGINPKGFNVRKAARQNHQCQLFRKKCYFIEKPVDII